MWDGGGKDVEKVAGLYDDSGTFERNHRITILTQGEVNYSDTP